MNATEPNKALESSDNQFPSTNYINLILDEVMDNVTSGTRIKALLIESVNKIINETEVNRILIYRQFVECMKDSCFQDNSPRIEDREKNVSFNSIGEKIPYSYSPTFSWYSDLENPWVREVAFNKNSSINYSARILAQTLSVLLVKETNHRAVYEIIDKFKGILKKYPNDYRVVGVAVYGLQLFINSASADKVILATSALAILYKALLSGQVEVAHYAKRSLIQLRETRGKFLKKAELLLQHYINLDEVEQKIRVDVEESLNELPFRNIIDSLKAKKNFTALIVHNIVESQGNEWIRNSRLVAGLVANGAKVTILTARPYLYNHSKIKVIKISNTNYSFDKQYDLVFNQYYSESCINTDLEQKIPQLIPLSKLYFQTAYGSNYLNVTYPFYRINGGTIIRYDADISAPNPHICSQKFVSEMGLSFKLADLKSIIINDQIDLRLSAIKTRANFLKVKKIVIFNPFGGNFEERGFLQDEDVYIAEEISRIIAQNNLVLFFPRGSEWGSAKRINQIRKKFSDSELKYLITDLPTFEEDQYLTISALGVADCMVSVEGGLTTIANSISLPVEMIRCKGSRSFIMWQPKPVPFYASEHTLSDVLLSKKLNESDLDWQEDIEISDPKALEIIV